MVHLARDRFRPFMSFRVRFAGNLVGRCNVLLRIHRHANKFNREGKAKLGRSECFPRLLDNCE